MSVGKELDIRVFFPNDMNSTAFAWDEDLWKDGRFESNWRGYQYGLQFVRIPAEDAWKLFYIINSHLKLEEISRGEGVVFGSASPGKESASSLVHPGSTGRRAAERISGSASGQNFRIDVYRSSFINEEGNVGLGIFDFIALKGNCAFYQGSENPGMGKARCHFGALQGAPGMSSFAVTWNR